MKMLSVGRKGGRTTGVEHRAKNGVQRQDRPESGNAHGGGVQSGEFCDDGEEIAALFEGVLEVLERIFDYGPLTRFGPMGARDVGHAHAGPKKAERDQEDQENMRAYGIKTAACH